VTDPAWVQDYLRAVTPMVESRGGRFLARTVTHEKLEGEREPPQVYLLVEWPSKQAAEEFYASDEYRPYREQRQAGARTELAMIAGEDVAGLARVPD
jgi:uncharacterized protein (DUF1330 family)